MKKWERMLLYSLAVTQTAVILMGAGGMPNKLKVRTIETAGLQIVDDGGNKRIQLSASAGGALLQVFDQNGLHSLINLGVIMNQPILSASDNADEVRFRLYMRNNEDPELQLIDEAGKVFWQAP